MPETYAELARVFQILETHYRDMQDIEFTVQQGKLWMLQTRSGKRDPADFVLWKPSPDDLPGWDSPWGRGRPGWHIECSAMSWEHLGETFDIHGGGLDLIFPHHENEIDQSPCPFGTAAKANYWMQHG